MAREKLNKESGLTDKEEIFVEQLLLGVSQTEAARRAGYSFPNRVAHKLQGLERVQTALAASKMGQKLETLKDITPAWVLLQSVEVYNRSMARKPVMIFDKARRMEVPLIDENGSHVWKHDAQIAIKALTLVGNHVNVKAFADKALSESNAGQEEKVDYSLLGVEELERVAQLEAEMERLTAKALKAK